SPRYLEQSRSPGEWRRYLLHLPYGRRVPGDDPQEALDLSDNAAPAHRQHPAPAADIHDPVSRALRHAEIVAAGTASGAPDEPCVGRDMRCARPDPGLWAGRRRASAGAGFRFDRRCLALFGAASRREHSVGASRGVGFDFGSAARRHLPASPDDPAMVHGQYRLPPRASLEPARAELSSPGVPREDRGSMRCPDIVVARLRSGLGFRFLGRGPRPNDDVPVWTLRAPTEMGGTIGPFWRKRGRSRCCRAGTAGL